ncbi:MAG: tyrosine-type recombinase/integrase [Clostridium celatum]|uniref:tyrosine-type recombinase/integrase n=1 Tax=Clostridium tertium TaxID=1559 RepID=UPI0028FE36E0|nr:tyrosine-type recombinase/integrase [Clostridium celatum]
MFNNKSTKNTLTIDKLLKLAESEKLLAVLEKLDPAAFNELDELQSILGVESSRNNKTSTKSKGKKTRPLQSDEFANIIKHLNTGFIYNKNGKKKVFRPKKYLALTLTIQATLGLRISDILELTVAVFQKGMLEKYEEKTNKLVYRPIPDNLINIVLNYALEQNLKKDDKICPVKDRNIREQLSIVCNYLGYKDIGTHSFRKYFARTIYQDTGDLELVRVLLNHSSLTITQKYIGVSQERVNEVSKSIDFSAAFKSSLNDAV